MKHRRVLFIQLSQFRIALHRFIVIAVFVFSIFLIFLSRTSNRYIKTVQSGTLSLLNPVIRVFQLPSDGVYFVYFKFKDWINVYEDNKALKERTRNIYELKSRIKILEAENKRLSEILHFVPQENVRFLTAKVVSDQKDGFVHTLTAYTTNAKEAQKNSIVLDGENVIGRVESINGNYIKILLITDINSKIPVIILPSGTQAILSGNNTPTLDVLYTESTSQIKKGDKIITSGIGGVFPEGLRVGVVSSAKKGKIKARPIKNIESSEYIIIVDYTTHTPQSLEDKK